MAYFTESPLPRYREEDLPGTVRRLYSFCQELQETLLFVLSNLDADNIEGYEEIFNRLAGADGAISILKQTAEEISAQVRKGTDQIADLTVRADGITQRVQDAEKGVAEVKVTADGISQRVMDNEGNISSLQQTASGLASQVASAEGAISSVKQTADGIQQAVYGKNGNGATTSVTANGLLYEVFNENGKFSRLAQTVEGIDITGAVTFNDLKGSGKSVINGDNITTGQIDAERLMLYGPMEVYEDSRARSLGGYIGFVEGKAYNDSGSLRSTEGIGVKAPSTNSRYDGGMVVCTDSGARLTFGPDMFGSTTTIACVSEHCYSSEPMETFSDIRLKRDVNYDIAEKYGAFYRALRPCRFIMNRDTRGAFQVGFIAQDVKQALEEHGLAMSDFAALTQFRSEEPDSEGIYALRYGEFAALNAAMVQQLLGRVDALEAEVKALKGEA